KRSIFWLADGSASTRANAVTDAGMTSWGCGPPPPRIFQARPAPASTMTNTAARPMIRIRLGFQRGLPADAGWCAVGPGGGGGGGTAPVDSAPVDSAGVGEESGGGGGGG